MISPSCPSCDGSLFVTKIRTGGALFRPENDYFRCWRCFHKFTPADEEGDQPAEQIDAFDRRAESKDPRVEITAVDLELETEGTQRAVEAFAVTVENRTTAALPVTQVLLSFDGGEMKMTPKNETVVGSEDSATIDVHWSWIPLEHETMTVTLRSRDSTVASTDVTLSKSD
ncbi:hypothetical protein [Natronorubrum texcoconense]|uniref:Uncharacterized protein n=1 Tax=Natronorubrum texcoconense TaxID=1095776 RepID=A0A1G8U0M7_9EURY|nr:hypothetical protein [Natronorubrum texcoconense]SDJ47279.1 hypothetical protein SAMN04515672_0682 [Natronorubrum texcoconense]